VAFTLLLRASTALLGVSPQVWSWLSGALLIALGLAALFPTAWDAVAARLGLQARSGARLARAQNRKGLTGEVLTGAALGPVFSSCSPMYAYVVASVVPAEPLRGVVLLGAYVIGLCGTLLVVALLGQRVLGRLGWLADPHGWFRRGLGVVFIAVGLAVATGFDRDLQTWVIENSPLKPWELDSGFIPSG
jgi:cytochrome c biogenesis protein CcdA